MRTSPQAGIVWRMGTLYEVNCGDNAPGYNNGIVWAGKNREVAAVQLGHLTAVSKIYGKPD